MADVLALRTALRADNANLDAAVAHLEELESFLNDPDLPPASRAGTRAEVIAQSKVVQRLRTIRDAALAAYQAAVIADPMHATDAGLPLVLLPVRIETAYLPNAAGATDLVVRVYPDDIHVDTHEPELTAAELSAGTDYWKAIWGAGPNPERLDAAWNLLLGKLKPARAAWAIHILTPAVARPAEETPLDQAQPEPPLPTVATRSGTFTRAPRTTLLPDHWHVLGFRDGAELFNVDGSPIPDTLNVSFGPPGTGAATNDLPFDDTSRWLVDLDAAIAAGMAIRISLPGPDLTVDQLFVLGVSSQIVPADAAARLEAALLAHQYTNGLGFLPPGTPTNNTSASRSAWQSAPQPPTPSEIENARSSFAPASSQNAALTAKALGIDGSEALSVADHGLDDQQSALVVLQKQFWNCLEGNSLSLLYNHWDIPPGGSPSQGGWHMHDNPDTRTMLRDHVMGWVRSRGTLPVMRVGNQPYGLLPVSSLADWVTADTDPTAPLIGWLRSFQQYFEAAVATAPRVVVGGEQDPDSTVANVLHRLPVSQVVMLRHDGDPFGGGVAGDFPVAPIPGLPTNSELFYAAPQDSATRMPIPIVVDPTKDQALLVEFLTFFIDSVNVLNGTMQHADWVTKYQKLFGERTFVDAPPPDLFTSLFQDSLTDPFINTGDSVVAGIIFGAFAFGENQNQNNPDFQAQIQKILAESKDFLAQIEATCAVDSANYDPMVRELMDIASHRFDAWVTSLAARRLDAMRAAKPTGVVLGAYGWVEDLAPRTDLTPVAAPPAGFDSVFSSNRQKYIHAPSLHHAATAAVLRAGFESHPNPQALAVNLESARVRKADWLAAGVRQGQTVRALLGYRFERGLHDAQLDAMIATLRVQHPQPLPTGPDPDEHGPAAREAIAARNVVDGLDCIRQSAAVLAQFQAGDQPAVSALLDDLADVLDAYGDLLLAESVHHLVGGNPLRAGLSADMVGRGEQIPDRFDVTRTPRSGRSLTWQVGVLLPTSFGATVTGWKSDRPRAVIEPHVNAWVATMLGNASLWQIACSVTSADGTVSAQQIGLDTLGICALDVIVESSGEQSVLERRIIDALTATEAAGSVVTVPKAPATDGSLGFAELVSISARIGTLLSQAVALSPQHVQGPDSSPTAGLDVAELAARLTALQSSLSASVTQLSGAAAALASAPDPVSALAAVRSALLQLADLGIASAYPAAGSAAGSDAVKLAGDQAATVLSIVQPLANLTPPSTPDLGAQSTKLVAWMKAASDYVQSIAGKTIPLVPSFLLPADSVYAASYAPAAAPAGADKPAVMAWLRRLARVRPNITTFHDLLLANESFSGPGSAFTTTHLPVENGSRWIGLPFDGAAPAKARMATVVSTPVTVDPSTAFCGLLFDTWTEQIPGLTTVANPAKGYESSEVTGVAFTVDAPDAYPPQAILLAVAPDPSAGWSLDILSDVVQETLTLAKVRTVDLGDLPRLGRVLPGLHSGSNLDSVFNAARVP